MKLVQHVAFGTSELVDVSALVPLALVPLD
jgi:hypothetical protein